MSFDDPIDAHSLHAICLACLSLHSPVSPSCPVADSQGWLFCRGAAIPFHDPSPAHSPAIGCDLVTVRWPPDSLASRVIQRPFMAMRPPAWQGYFRGVPGCTPLVGSMEHIWMPLIAEVRGSLPWDCLGCSVPCQPVQWIEPYHSAVVYQES